MNSKNVDQESFEETKKRVLNKIWHAVPRKLRVPIVIALLIITALASTHSYWKPLLFDRPPPERCILMGHIFMNSEPIAMPIQLHTEDKNYKAQSDEEGLVVFNIEKSQRILKLVYVHDEEMTEVQVDNNALKSSEKFQLEVNEGKLLYDE
ncbi:MAG: hypothetical protein ABFS05_04575 [Bacteroidota bacterium]